MSLSSNRGFIIIETSGLYMINYGVRSSSGLPGICTISFSPGGIDESGKIALQANTLVSGSIVRRLGAQTRVSLHIDSTNNNSPVSLPATSGYCNAFISVTRIGPYPTTT